MWWLTWRQHRVQIVVLLALLLGLGALLLASGAKTADFIAAHPGCPGDGPACAGFDSGLSRHYQAVYQLLGQVPYLPALIGAFWGAPLLAREYERGTHKLAWTQSVSRRRWLLVKLGGLAALVTACGLVLGAMVSGWLSTFAGTELAHEGFTNSGLFIIDGVVPGAWFLLMFTVGAAAGALTRRTLPAIAVCVAVFAAAIYGFTLVRPSYAEPERVVVDDRLTMPGAGSMLIHDSRWIDPAGREVPDDGWPGEADGTCADLRQVEAYYPCLYDAGYRQTLTYQPADRHTRFQWTEAGILLVLSAVLAGLTAVAVLRRRV